jgi:hypothetical protein
MAQQGTFAATAATHYDKNISMIDSKTQIPLDNKITVSHGQV